MAAAVTTGGLVVLLAGPTSTFGLGVPGAGDATGTVQGAVQTTQQTAASTVTQVESTVQTTVQAPAQAVAAPAPSAPAAAAPVQTTVQNVAAAPKQTASRVAAPVKKRAATVKAPSTSSQRLSSAPELSGQARTVRTTVVRRASTVRTTKTARPQRSASVPRQSSATDAPAQCDLTVLSLLPGAGELTGLLALACNTVTNLDLPNRIGLAPQSVGGMPSLADLLVTPASGLPAPTRARSAARGGHATTGAGSRPAAGAAQAGDPSGWPAIPVVAGAGHAGAVVYADSFKNASASTGSVIAGTNAGDTKTPHHHSWFSGQSRGTELLMAILFASLSVLAGIVLWRLALRWVIPHFA